VDPDGSRLDAAAEHLQLPARDLVASPPEDYLLAEVDPELVVELGWVACELTVDGRLVVATSVPAVEELLAEVEERFPGRRIEFVACTRRDLDAVALAALRLRQPRGAAQPPPADLVRPLHYALVAVLGAAALVAAFFVPLEVLAVVVLCFALVFLLGAASQSVGSYSGLTPVVAAGEGAGDDTLLPAYTVLLRAADEASVRAALADLGRLDYPPDRLDALLLVPADDATTAAGVRRAAPPEWVRVVPVPAERYDDPVASLDHGLALARGRYVVAFAADERPAADQLRRAVAAFEADLDAGLSAGPGAVPLVGLRAARRADAAGRSGFARMTAVDEALDLGGLTEERVPTSTHFNMRLLRRHGGFALASSDLPAGVRIEPFDSISVRAADPGPIRWTHDRAEAWVRAVRRARATGHPVVVREVLIPLTFLAYPVAVVGALVAAVRGTGADGALAQQIAWLGMGEAAIVLGGAVVVAAVAVARRRGRVAALYALALPAHWLLHAVAAWVAVAALVVRTASPRRAG
jgi:hypothetical protein